MHWPPEITAAFAEAIDVAPIAGETKETVIQYLLDETARRAVWRAKADPTQLAAAYHAPYTPLGSVTADGMRAKAKSLTIKAPWNHAVDRLYAFVGESAALICNEFRDQRVEYHDEV